MWMFVGVVEQIREEIIEKSWKAMQKRVYVCLFEENMFGDKGYVCSQVEVEVKLGQVQSTLESCKGEIDGRICLVSKVLAKESRDN